MVKLNTEKLTATYLWVVCLHFLAKVCTQEFHWLWRWHSIRLVCYWPTLQFSQHEDISSVLSSRHKPVLEILLSSFLQMSSRCSFISVAVLLISPKENWGLMSTLGTMASGGTHRLGKFCSTSKRGAPWSSWQDRNPNRKVARLNNIFTDGMAFIYPTVTVLTLKKSLHSTNVTTHYLTYLVT